MTFDKLSSLVCRLFFTVSFVLLALSVLEAGAREFGYTILRSDYGPGRLIEYSAIMLVFVVALLLRQIRESVQKP